MEVAEIVMKSRVDSDERRIILESLVELYWLSHTITFTFVKQIDIVKVTDLPFFITRAMKWMNERQWILLVDKDIVKCISEKLEIGWMKIVCCVLERLVTVNISE